MYLADTCQALYEDTSSTQLRFIISHEVYSVKGKGLRSQPEEKVHPLSATARDHPPARASQLELETKALLGADQIGQQCRHFRWGAIEQATVPLTGGSHPQHCIGCRPALSE